MSATVDAVIAEVTDANTVIDGAIVFVNSVPGLINDAVQKALGNGATAEELAPLTDLGSTLQGKASALKQALTANTPPTPPTPPTAAPKTKP